MKNRNYYSNGSDLYPSELGDFNYGMYRNLVQNSNRAMEKSKSPIAAILENCSIANYAKKKHRRR